MLTGASRSCVGAARAAGQLAADRRHRPIRGGAAPLRYAGRRRDAHRQGRADARDHGGSLRMIRWLLWLLGGLLLGGIVHLATVLLLPRTATQDAYTRLAATAPANSIAPLPAPTPDDAVLPFMDPAFATAVCRYDLAAGPLQASRAGQPGLHIGLVLRAQRRRLLRDQRPRRRPAHHRARSDDDRSSAPTFRMTRRSPPPTG